MTDPTPPANRRTCDHLANERTFVAWVRTSVSVTGLGFVVARFGLWLRQLAAHVDPAGPHVRHTRWSLPMGVGMMAAGGLLAVLAAGRYRRVRQAIDRNDPAAAGHAVAAVTLVVLAATASRVVYMLAGRGPFSIIRQRRRPGYTGPLGRACNPIARAFQIEP